MSYAIPKEENDDNVGGEFLMGLGTDGGDEYFCSLIAHSLMTWKQRRTVLFFDIARLPLRAK